ncbi:MAG: hypothetical protein BWX66_01126 [Deltaproteobacteria bacterium ADurb.Bin058]|nr:MAG: hypothetical protein BWX66_01126 [Deltaproteobacteria bacterium ADurb.Bin058]
MPFVCRYKNEVSKERGITAATIKAALRENVNKNITKVTNRAPSVRLVKTVFNVVFTNSVRS